ncbi:MAG: metallophosphoesterase family protein [Bacilli bacterium]
MQKQITFLHMADVHLGALFQNLDGMDHSFVEQFRQSVEQSFTRLINEAVRRKVDFIVVAGDLFHHEERSLRGYSIFHRAFERLEAYSIPVFICYGNHDYVHANLPHWEWSKNVYEWKNETPERKVHTLPSGATIAVTSVSYTERHVYTQLIEQFPPRGDATWEIGMLHGTVGSAEGHEPYAPFTVEQLQALDRDYWALGHIHKPTCVSENPLAIYPGSVQGLHINEHGEHGGVFVTLDIEGNRQYEWYYSAPIVWATETVVLTNPLSQDVYRALQHVKQTYAEQAYSVFLRVCLKIQGDSAVDMRDLAEWRTLLNEEESSPFVWIGALQLIKQTETTNVDSYVREQMQTFMEEENETMFTSLAALHPAIAAEIDHLSEEERQTIIDAAKAMFSGKF